jgi:hypothetical protein
MITLNEFYAANRAKMEQLEHQAKLKENTIRAREKKSYDALCFRVGGSVHECWPWVAQFQERLHEEDNEVVLAPFKEFLIRLSATEEYKALLNELVNETATPAE